MFQLLLDRLAAVGPLVGDLPSVDKITSRAALAALSSFALTLVCGPRWIGWLKRHFREPIKSASDEVARLHRDKQWTPTMGGLFIVGGLVGSTLLFADLTNPLVAIALALAVGLTIVGACDDWIKLATKARGLRATVKLAWQMAIALAVAVMVYRTQDAVPLTIPLVGTQVMLGAMFVPLAALVIVSASNGVNLTDGLDGLAGGCLVFATAAVAVVVYASGHAQWADYLGIAHLQGAGEMVVVAAGMIGALLGFLWFNCHPASVFMGDTGSLPLGGLLGLLVVVARQEFLLVAIGGVFVAEAASVIAQVACFRVTGRRIFLCAPLHHHFQLKGWPEDKIVVRFWIAAALCGIVGLAGLKLQSAETRPRTGSEMASQDQSHFNELSMGTECHYPQTAKNAVSAR
jgi:phospho-N-acetylmuramoyl-pentapeptide-transferase